MRAGIAARRRDRFHSVRIEGDGFGSAHDGLQNKGGRPRADRNRLAKITELTGRDTGRTEDRVDLYLALEADELAQG